MKKEKNIYNLALHEDLVLENERTMVKRVAGGWLYSQQIPQCNLYEVVFVPYNNEFQKEFVLINPTLVKCSNCENFGGCEKDIKSEEELIVCYDYWELPF